MTAIVSPQPSQGAITPISPSSLSSSSSPSSTSTTTPTSAQPNSPQSQSIPSTEAQPASDVSPATATKSNPRYLTSPTTTTPSSEQHSSKLRSRSRESASRRQSYLSTRTTSTRPASSVFPTFVSSLSYALVRDFAYPSFHPLHYGPSPCEPTHSESEASSPSYNVGYGGTFSLDRRLSDPPPSWEGNRGMWSAGPWGGDGGAVFGIEGGGAAGDQLPSTSFGYDSDEPEGGGGGSSGIGAGKLTKNHRKSRSFASGEEATSTNRRRKSEMGGISNKKEQKKDMSHLGTGLDSQGFFQPGATNDEEEEHQRHDEEEGGLPRGSYFTQSTSGEPEDYQNEHHHDDGSLDESFAGPSLALYTFQPENTNELALREGQIIQVGYRHGQGWLVAMDLETGEQGLVPEEYVRLLRDIEGWGEEEMEEGEEEDELEDETEQKQGNDGSSARRDKRAITVTTETRTETNDGDEVKVADIEPALGKRAA